MALQLQLFRELPAFDRRANLKLLDRATQRSRGAQAGGPRLAT